MGEFHSSNHLQIALSTWCQVCFDKAAAWRGVFLSTSGSALQVRLALPPQDPGWPALPTQPGAISPHIVHNTIPKSPPQRRGSGAPPPLGALTFHLAVSMLLCIPARTAYHEARWPDASSPLSEFFQYGGLWRSVSASFTL